MMGAPLDNLLQDLIVDLSHRLDVTVLVECLAMNIHLEVE